MAIDPASRITFSRMASEMGIYSNLVVKRVAFDGFRYITGLQRKARVVVCAKKNQLSEVGHVRDAVIRG